MPFRAISTVDGQSLHAFDLDEEAWQALKGSAEQKSRLVMPCCRTRAVPKTSSRGRHFFAHHRPAENCPYTASESEAHRALKHAAVIGARRAGWHAETEVSGSDGDGHEWRADVLASRGKVRVAVEVQLAPMTMDELRRRQSAYRSAGVRGLWLHRYPRRGRSGLRFEDRDECQAIPVFALQGGDEGWSVLGHEPATFVEKVLTGHLVFGLRPGMPATVEIETRTVECWGRKCGAKYQVVSEIAVRVGHTSTPLRLHELTPWSDPGREIIRELSKHPAIGPVKMRYSATVRRRYLSVGCPRCDRIFGKHYALLLFDTPIPPETPRFETTLTPGWVRALDEDECYRLGWVLLDEPLSAPSIR